MHMKQRHQAERDIVRAERVGFRDGAYRCRQVPMTQGYALRPSGAAAGVQDQRDIVGIGFRRAGVRRNLRRDHRDPACSAARRASAASPAGTSRIFARVSAR